MIRLRINSFQEFALRAACLGGLLLAATGCRSIGPATVPRDRSEYSTAIADSWKRQTLLNIVKMRYLDPPIFVDVGQIVAGYSLETSLSAGGSFAETTILGGDTATVGGAARFTDRPTITYVPLTGNNFIRGLLTPVPPQSVFFLIQSGYPADGVLLIAASSLNGLKNQEVSLGSVAPPAPAFLRVLELLRKIQLSGAVGLRVEMDVQKQETTILTFRRGTDLSPEIAEASREMRRLLGLDPEATEFKLVFAAAAASSTEIAVVTRSLIQLMQGLAIQVDVPAEHVTQGRAVPGWESASAMPDATRLIRIHSSKSKHQDAAVAIDYRGHSFWIDDRDLKSKRTFSFMMMMFALANTGQKENLPLITIPAQ